MATSLVTHLISPMKLLSTSNELKVDERNKHIEINKLHVPTVLYGYIIQAFRIPFTIQHSPTVEQSQPLRTTTTARIQYRSTPLDLGARRASDMSFTPLNSTAIKWH